jgi:hypothetical protein
MFLKLGFDFFIFLTAVCGRQSLAALLTADHALARCCRAEHKKNPEPGICAGFCRFFCAVDA